MKTKRKTKKRRLVKRKDYDGWVWELLDGKLIGFKDTKEDLFETSWWPLIPTSAKPVKVKLVKV